MYKLTRHGFIIRLADGAEIPPDTNNADYQRYLADLRRGIEPTPADPAPVRRDRLQAAKEALATGGFTKEQRAALSSVLDEILGDR